VANPLDSLPFGPLVAVDPDLHRIREIGAHLDKRRPEIVVPEIEVITRDPPTGLGEREPHTGGAPTVFGRQEHRRELLRHPDRGHPRLTCRRLPCHKGAHPIDLAVILTEPHHRDVVVGGEPVHRPAEPGTDLLQDRRRGDLIAQMRDQKRHHLPAHLQIRHITVQIDPIQALQIQAHMPVEHIVHRRHRSHHLSLAGQARPDQRPAPACRDRPRAGSDRSSTSSQPQRSHPTRTTTSAVRGGSVKNSV
jgi:hypothetical protein